MTRFGNHKTNYNNCIYDSKAEANYAMWLDSELRKGKIKGWDRQIRIPMVVNGVKICTYIVDFSVTDKTGKIKYVEIKGYPTRIFQMKWVLVKALFPDQVFEMVKAKDLY